MQVIDGALEFAAWTTQTGPTVNPVPADAFLATQLPSGALKVTNVSSKAMGGALVTCKRPVPSIPGTTLPYLGLDLQLLVSQYDLPLLARKEIDVKAALTPAPSALTSIANVANFSSQFDASTRTWQIDGSPPGWVDTGFKPVLTPDVWMPLSFRYFMDIPNGKFSFLSVNWGGLFEVPASMQELPLQQSNWAQVAAIQLQTEILSPGGLTTLYRGITLTWSDRPF
jgi:hypothetical protein